MSKKVPLTDPFQPKITRNDRFAQMSHQEKVIEQKKREIQAKLEAKQKKLTETVKASSPTPINNKQQAKAAPPKKAESKKAGGFNLFSNDGSFLDTFKQMKDKKLDAKSKPNKTKENYEKSYNEQRGNKHSRWSQRRRSPSPKDRSMKFRISRFGDKSTNFEPKITINTSFSNQPVVVQQPTFIENPPVISPQNVTGQPLLKNMLPPPGVVYPTASQTSAPVIAAPPLLLNVPPPQIVQNTASSTLILPNSSGNVLVSSATVNVTIPATGLTTVTLPPHTGISTQSVTSVGTAIPVPPPCIPTIELASIPPPNPIQVQNIPQPEPLNALNIPHPAPIQVQNIPTPTSIQLNEIPNPKPLDLLAIPTPTEDKSISDPDFIKNVPPPNKSVPPPTLETNVNVPPPTATVQLPPPSINLVQGIAPCQNILVHTMPPPQPVPQIQSMQPLAGLAAAVPPPNFAPVAAISVALPVGVVPTTPTTVTNPIPSLMAQPILPPPGMRVTTVNVSCPPPPMISLNASVGTGGAGGVAGVVGVGCTGGTGAPPPPPPPNFVNQPPPISAGQMPPMNVPPPQTGIQLITAVTAPTVTPVSGPYPDMNSGTPDYEAMASLGRMVAQCGPGIEDVVRQRKTQDPNLWFLFNKESAAYRQYLQLVEQFKREIMETKESKYNPDEIYEPEKPIDDDNDSLVNVAIDNMIGSTSPNDTSADFMSTKRKRKSRWGDKDPSIPPPTVRTPTVPNVALPQNQNPGNVMLSKVTRSEPALVQYVINTYGSTNITEEEWKKAEDHYKINLLYQDMVKKREELERLQQAGKNKYDYDSDEDVDGGTWEHKLRDKEMMATQLWAQELTRQAEGKHHIGDFLPPDEFKKFMEKSSVSKEGRTATFSDYKEFKIKEDNIGFKMLQKLGWSQGQGLGQNGSGIVEPVNKAIVRDQNQGLGLGEEDDDDKEDEYEAYRKRMMLAYRFRPNPLNNPRRPYY